MAWDEAPADGVDFQAWAHLRQYWRAARERACVIGGEQSATAGRWPRYNVVHDTGTITAVTATSLTDSGKTWETSPLRWVDYVNEAAPWVPSSYDVIIDSPDLGDPTQVLRAQITDHTSTTLTITDLTEQVTARVAPDLASLVGRTYHIVKRGGLWWSERWPEWPNDRVLLDGTITGEAPAGAGTLQVLYARWQPDQFAGADVMFRDAGDVLRRGNVTGNTADTLTFTGAGGDPVAGGAFYVVANEGRFVWDATPAPPASFYRGLSNDGYYTRLPDDTVGVTGKPTFAVTYSSGNGIVCEPTTVTVLDADFWSALDEQCSEPDKCYTPDVFKALRMLQAFVENTCVFFVDPTLTYEGAAAIPLFTPATLFERAGINAQRATATGFDEIEGLLAVPFDVPWEPIGVHFAVLDPATGDVLAYGFGTYDDGNLNGSGITADHAAATVVISLGWTRWVPRTFRRMFDKTVFIPDLDPDAEGGPAPIDPPQEPDGPLEPGPGEWKTRGKSTHYLMPSETLGFVDESAEDVDAFADGDLARYVGDNWCDPTIFPYESPDSPTPPLVGYYSRFYTGRLNDVAQRALVGTLRGLATGGSNRHLVDATKNWWEASAPDDAGVIKTHAGTATGGSDTSLSDSSKASSAFWKTSPPEEADTGNRWVGFVVEINFPDPDTGAAVWVKRPITSHAGDTIAWGEPLPGNVSASGREYRIREPGYELNRWKGRQLIVWQRGVGRREPITITHSTDDTLFFDDAGFDILPGDRYAIQEWPTSTVWQWDADGGPGGAGAWVKPTGIDPRSGEAAVRFLDDQACNAPTTVKRYGRTNLGDYFTRDLLEELYDCFNLMRWTRESVTWTNTDASSVTHDNVHYVPPKDFERPYDTFGEMMTERIGEWGDFPDSADPLEPPRAVARGVDLLEPFKDGDLIRVASYGRVDEVPTEFASEIDYYVYASIDEDDHEAGSRCVADALGAPGNAWSDFTFDANGSGTLYHQYHKWYAEPTPASGATRTSGQIGSIASAPNAAAAPSAPGPCYDPGVDYAEQSVNGWYAQRKWAVARWDVAGGFTYVDPLT